MKNPLFYWRYIGTTSYANGCTAFVDISRRIPAECTRGLHFLRDPATVGSNQSGQQGPTQTHGTALPPTLSCLGGWIIILTGSNRRKKIESRPDFHSAAHGFSWNASFQPSYSCLRAALQARRRSLNIYNSCLRATVVHDERWVGNVAWINRAFKRYPSCLALPYLSPIYTRRAASWYSS